ncbi:MAG: heavy metal translocating P-type ATPase [Eubacteriales bacterium]
MVQYHVTGMSCAACQTRVEKAVGAMPGVTSCAVSLLTNAMSVEGSAEPAAVIAAVEAAGYGASLKSENRQNSASGTAASGGHKPSDGEEDALADRQTPLLGKRLCASVVFLVLLMYLSMGHAMWGFPLPAVLADNPLTQGLLQLLLCVLIMVINQKFFISGFAGLLHRAPNMDTLVALGSTAAFLYSTWELFSMSADMLAGDMHAVHNGLHNLYFESAATILTLITVGKMLEARAKGKTTDALKSLMRLKPKTARVRRNGTETEIPIGEVRTGDTFLVRPGENIPCDGTVIEGVSAVNEAALTGESIPVDKAAGDSVSAATTNTSGVLVCEATRVGEDTTLAQIIRMVSDAAATKAPIAKTADRISGVFVPVVIALAFLTAIIWLVCGQTFGYALARGISVLVISCPCALGLATPVAIMVGSGVGAKNGILFKTAAALEGAGRTDVVVLDKTGTVTKGEPYLTDIVPAPGVRDGDTLLRLAASLEQNSEHPLAKAIRAGAAERGIAPVPVRDFRALPGSGLTAVIEEHDGTEVHAVTLSGGSMAYMEKNVTAVPPDMKRQAEEMANAGKTPLFFAYDRQLLGILAVADIMKEDSPEAVRQLREMGIRVVMLTGDNARTAAAVGKAAGVDEVIAGVLPDGKEAVVRTIQESGRKVMMVGDGINDAPALTRADIGCAVGAGADVALDAADMVLVRSRPADIPASVRLGRAVLRNIHENLFWAFGYNIIGIPLAAGLFIPLFHWEMNPMFGAAAMSISSFCVVSNALRLNLISIRRTKSPKTGAVGAEPEIIQQTEEKTMTKTIRIKGMMCHHCEAHVKKALEALDGVSEAAPDYEKGIAAVTLTKDVADADLKSAVEACDYEVLGIE